MRRPLFVAFVAILALVGSALSGAPALAQSKSANTASDVGITPTTIRIAVDRRRRQPDRSRRAAGHRRRCERVREVRQRHRRRRRAQGPGRLHRLEAQPERRPQRDHPGVLRRTSPWWAPRRCCCRPSDDETSCADKAGKATGLPDVGAGRRISREGCSPNVVPDPADVGGVQHRRQRTADVPGNNGDSKYLLKKNGNSPRFVRRRERLRRPSERTSTLLGMIANKAGIKSDQNDWW